jgi:serine/threonine protein kinase
VKDPSAEKAEHSVDSTEETQFIPDQRDSTAGTKASPAGESGLITPPPGPHFKYEILRELGKGGFAWVYLVRNLDLDRMEAIKVLSSKLDESEMVERFVKEARIAANFNHQNIVTIYEVQKAGKWAHFKVPAKISERHPEPFTYFTMSFVEGNTATNIIKSMGKIPERKAIRIAIDTLMALDYAHGKGVIHRDIKPDNILVDRKGTAIVTDFGIAKAANQTRLTAAGTFMGTARYVSPEQALGQEIDGRSDLYSLGIALYEMVTGKVPFDSDAWMTVLYQHINEVPAPPETFHAEIDRDLQRIILRMLEKRPEKRFQSARECADALNRLFQRLGGEDLRTEAMDRIGTRPDLLAPDGTRATDYVAAKAAAGKMEPPIRSQSLVVEATPGLAEVQGSNRRLWFPLALTAVAATVVLLWFFLSPKPSPPPLADKPLLGQLLVSAFPRGEISQLFRIEGERKQSENLTQRATPLWLDLPAGEYEILVSYEGFHHKKTVIVRGEGISRVHVEFQVESERFLLEDMR